MKNTGYLLAGFLLACCIGAGSTPTQVGRYQVGSGIIIDTTNGRIVAHESRATYGGRIEIQWRDHYAPTEWRGVSHGTFPVQRCPDPKPIEDAVRKELDKASD